MRAKLILGLAACGLLAAGFVFPADLEGGWCPVEGPGGSPGTITPPPATATPAPASPAPSAAARQWLPSLAEGLAAAAAENKRLLVFVLGSAVTGEEPLAGEVGAACPELVLALVSGAALTAEERGRLALADDAGGLVLLDAQGGLLLQFPPPLPTLEEFREALAALPGTAAAPPPARKASPD